MDEEGIRPDALEAACATTEAKALYCMPTLQNPTAVVMSEKRRQEIVASTRSGEAPIAWQTSCRMGMRGRCSTTSRTMALAGSVRPEHALSNASDSTLRQNVCS